MRQPQRYYTEEFKLSVVRQIRQGLMTKESARRHYSIGGKSLILKWMRLYENYGVCSLLLAQRTMATKQPKTFKEQQPAAAPTSEQQQLEQRIKQLERQLEDAQLLGEMYDRMITIAERQYNIPIRKKPGTK